MASAACLAVAHSPSAGALSHDLELGAMARIWASVMVFLVDASVVDAAVADAVGADVAGTDEAGTDGTGVDWSGVDSSQPALASAKKKVRASNCILEGLS